MRLCIPSALRRWSNGQETVELEFAETVTLGEVITRLGHDFPGVRQRVLDDQGVLRRHVNVFVDGENVRLQDGIATEVPPDAEVRIFPAISGGNSARQKSRP